MKHFVKIKHPAAGLLDFDPWSYQKSAIKCFRKYRKNIFKKTRQAGISKISGAFALWYGMFHSHKSILIVSKTDEDAKTFLEENIKFPFNNLPDWMRELWDVNNTAANGRLNDHQMHFPDTAGGSKIRSLTSAPNVLRSNASSLNIIDEAAFIKDMDEMWASGGPTLTHGGSVIVISTTNGIGGWYWSTFTDAEAGLNDFNPLVINWWDMDWSVTYHDELSGEQRKICPRDGIRPTTKQEFEKYGPYWSPWLEEQYRLMQSRGEAWKFKQEILAAFLGSGNTILDTSVLNAVNGNIDNTFNRVVEPQVYIHPITKESSKIEFTGDDDDEGLWIWTPPVRGIPEVKRNNKVITPGVKPHRYAGGVDLATGKGRDYNALVMLDVDTLRQVAELMIRCKPSRFLSMVDRIGRYYNNALLVVERNNGGDLFIDDLRDDCAYPRVWRKVENIQKPGSTSTRYHEYGYFTVDSTKFALNRALIDHVREDNNGVITLSSRLYKQLATYVRHRDRSGRDTGKTGAQHGSFDDLVMAFAMALIGLEDAHSHNEAGLVPLVTDLTMVDTPPAVVIADTANKFLEKGGRGLVAPMMAQVDDSPELNIMYELNKYAQQIGSLPISEANTFVKQKKYNFEV